jgi:hypothetical protein
MGLTYDIVSILPFTEEIKKRKTDENDETIFEDFEIEDKSIFCFGSVKFAHIGSRRGWSPGSLFNENHDFQIYSEKYKGHMLNDDVIIQSISDPLPNLPVLFFARPCKDTKLFSGGVFMKDSWNEMVESLIINHNHRDITGDTVMFSHLKQIAFEVRCWVVGGKIVTMSEYKRGNFVRYKNEDGNFDLKERVQKFVDLYSPARAFVIDVCETVDQELKIVEINCINCAGFYDANMQRLIESIEIEFDYSLNPNYE